MGHRIIFPRDLLLVEIDRYCADVQCRAKTRIGLTKEEARIYRGFKCERCERWHDDILSERDIPEWWEELAITSLDGARPPLGLDRDETSEVVSRLSDAWRRTSGNINEQSEEDSF